MRFWVASEKARVRGVPYQATMPHAESALSSAQVLKLEWDSSLSERQARIERKKRKEAREDGTPTFG